jgi:uncharacterized OsmC-like protein
MYARTKNWDLGEVTVDVDYDHRATPRRLAIDVAITGDLSLEQQARLVKVAASCPVRRTIDAGIEFEETFRWRAEQRAAA